MASGYQRTRRRGTRRFKRRVIIAAEGTVSEPEYFALLQPQDTTIEVRCLKGGNGSSPKQVLDRMQRHLRNDPLAAEDLAWLVCDKDAWTDDQLRMLHQWSVRNNQHGFALSNPKFEFWLLLHFENGSGIASAADVDSHLKRHVPNFDKHISDRYFTDARIAEACLRARKRDRTPMSDWPRTTGTTVYRLIDALLGRE